MVSGNVLIQTLACAFYDASWIIPIPTSTSISGWGSVGVNTNFLLPGLNAEYFSNRWFASTPALVQRKIQVNVDWGTGNILSFASDYVSVRWSVFLKPTYSEDFTFVARVNDDLRITIGDTEVIDKLDELVADRDSLTLTSSSISLIASSYVSIIFEYYDITRDAHIILEWYSASQTQEVIPASQFYSQSEGSSPISGSAFASSSIYTPMMVTAVKQSTDTTTFSASSLTILWTAPLDFGCSAITGYSISYTQSGTTSSSTVGLVITATLSSLTPGVSTHITVTAINSVGNGISSTSITLIPLALPSAPASVSVADSQKNAMTLQWSVPSDTGIGDSTTIAITSYLLQVDYGYGAGFQNLSSQTSLTFTHSGLIAGQRLIYRVAASNFLGQGSYSSSYTFAPIVVPSKPLLPPVPALITSTVIHIEYNAVEDDGGSAILNYNIYVDDGNRGAFNTTINNGLSLTYDTSSLALTTVLTYRFKYSSVNSQGEGPLSDGDAILLAEVSTAPQNFIRVDTTTLPAGTIRVTWEAPTSDGGSSISGYNIYLSQKLLYQAQNTENSYTFYGFTVSTTYSVIVSSVNAVGEGAQSSLTLLAASNPAKMARPTWKSSSTTDIQVQWTVPSYDGGSPITQYRVRRDDGPSTSFLSDVTTTNLYYDFTGLLNSVLTYRIQVATENALGVGEYSDPFDFYAASPPGTATNFNVNTQSTSQISLSWSKPTLIGSWPISGYNNIFAIFEIFQKFQKFHFLDKKLFFEGFRLGFSNWKVNISILGNLQLLNQSCVFWKSSLKTKKWRF